MRRVATVLAIFSPAVFSLVLSARAETAVLGRPDDMAGLLAARNWPAATALAAGSADPLAPALVSYLRLSSDTTATAADLDRFLTGHPDWPMRGTLERRYDEALARERDDDVARAACLRRPPAPAARLRCADAAARTGADGTADARAAWRAGILDAAAEIAFLRRWAGALTPDDQRARFERLAWTAKPEPGGTLARQAVRVAPADRPAAEARLALRRDDPTAAALFSTLPDPAKAEPGLVLDLLRWQRRTGHEQDAAKLWASQGAAAEAAAPPEWQRAFATERSTLARSLLRTHDDAAAYALAAQPTASDAVRADLSFLAGWIALWRLSQPDLAAQHFRALADAAHAVISQARAHYWLGRTLAASGSGAGAEAEYRQAARWPTTYYGQLAALALGDGLAGLGARIAGTADPTWTEAEALDVAAAPFGRAAALLVRWGQPRQARPFLEKLDQAAADPAGRALVARFATALGLPEAAVAAARRAGMQGVMLPGLGWPEAADPPPAPVERAVALGLIRQESSFDAAAGSPAGAQGLMQLMPGTAADTARRFGLASAPLSDPTVNMRLGTAYLGGLLDRFGALPAALAGYNAGPGRAREWITAFGDPAAGAIDPIDWVELIPFGETRDYVQRVIENVMIYRARRAADPSQPALPHPVLGWAGSAT